MWAGVHASVASCQNGRDLARHVVANHVRRAVARSVGHAGGHVGRRPGERFPCPRVGTIAAAVGGLRAMTRVVARAESAGLVPETIADVLPFLAGALVDATTPPPPPPNPAEAAPPASRSEVSPPSVRCAAYAFLGAVLHAHPGLIASGAPLPLAGGEHLRGRGRVPAAVTAAAAREVCRAAARAAVAEVAAASGRAGAAAAVDAMNGGGGEKKDATDNDADVAPRGAYLYATPSATAAKQRLKTLLGPSPPSGPFDDVTRAFAPPGHEPSHTTGNTNRHNGVAHTPTYSGGSHSRPRQHHQSTIATVADAPVGKDVDAAVAAARWLRAYASSDETARRWALRDAIPALRGALSEAGDRRLREAAREEVTALWGALGAEAGEPPPPPPPPQYASSSGFDSPPRGAASSALSRAAAVRDDAVAARAPWPADVPDVVSFASLKAAAAAAAAAGGSSTATAAANKKVSVVGAVHARDPPAGTKVVTNPKTQRAYDMLFITLGDHTGARIRAQLIGRPAKRAAAALDAERGGGRGGGETASRTTPFA